MPFVGFSLFPREGSFKVDVTYSVEGLQFCLNPSDVLVHFGRAERFMMIEPSGIIIDDGTTKSSCDTVKIVGELSKDEFYDMVYDDVKGDRVQPFIAMMCVHGNLEMIKRFKGADFGHAMRIAECFGQDHIVEWLSQYCIL